MLVNIDKLSRSEVERLSEGEIGESVMSEYEIFRIITAIQAGYNYNFALKLNQSTPPHAVLANGAHTDTYFKHEAFFHRSNIVDIMAHQLSKRLTLGEMIMKKSLRERLNENPILVIGPSYGATFLVAALAKYWKCCQGVTLKVVGKDQEWQTFPLPMQSTVQLVDDLIYSDSTITATHGALVEKINFGQAFIYVKSEVGTIINMSGMTKTKNEWKIKSLVSIKPQTWPANECELCKIGSVPLSVQNNWPELATACWREP